MKQALPRFRARNLFYLESADDGLLDQMED
jgi:hypothetical protein